MEKYDENLRQGVRRLAPRRSLAVLQELAEARQVQVFLVGGAVRELALGGQAPDLDLAVSARTLELGRELAGTLKGTFVLLDEGERTARVVWPGEILDLAEFRAPSLEGDLKARDFTINALALERGGGLGRGPPARRAPAGG